MQIDSKQLVGKPKKVGKTEGRDVLEIATKGGLHLIVAAKDGHFETLGTGPHRAVARYIAKKRRDIQWSDLNKADHVPYEFLAPLLPKYEAITDKLRQMHGDER